MPEIPNQIDKCDGCGQQALRSTDSRMGLGRSLVLDVNKLCVDCAPATRCDLGEPCEFGRVVAWRHADRAALKKLRMCVAHEQVQVKQLKLAKKRYDARVKAQRVEHQP